MNRPLTITDMTAPDMLIEHLTEHDTMQASRLYKFPYTDQNPGGVDALFTPQDANDIFSILDDVKCHAAH